MDESSHLTPSHFITNTSGEVKTSLNESSLWSLTKWWPMVNQILDNESRHVSIQQKLMNSNLSEIV